VEAAIVGDRGKVSAGYINRRSGRQRQTGKLVHRNPPEFAPPTIGHDEGLDVPERGDSQGTRAVDLAPGDVEVAVEPGATGRNRQPSRHGCVGRRLVERPGAVEIELVRTP